MVFSYMMSFFYFISDLPSCKLTVDELKDGLNVLIYMEGLFYEAQVQAVQPPDIYSVLIEGERGCRPHIYPQQELLSQAVIF